MQSAELAAAVLAAIAPDEKPLEPPRSFADVAALQSAVEAAGFHDIQSM